MRFFVILFSFIFVMDGHSCDVRMQGYPFECAYQDHFNKLQNEFKTYNISPLNLKGYLIPHIVGVTDYNSKKNIYLRHADANLANNQQWNIWRNPPDFISKLNPVFLEINDVIKVQSNLYPAKSLKDIFNSKIGKLRTGNAEINPTLSYGCEDDEQLNNKIVTLFDNYDLKTEEGYPLLIIKDVKNCKNSQDGKSGKIIFYKNASIKTELNRWLVDFNDTLSRFEMGQVLDVSPYQYIADMRRWFMAISPFAIGNASVAEALMLYANSRLHLPPVGQAIQSSPFLLTVKDNRNQVIDHLKESLTFFESCLYETKTNLISDECAPL
jgi:hypothetical protein